MSFSLRSFKSACVVALSSWLGASSAVGAAMPTPQESEIVEVIGRSGSRILENGAPGVAIAVVYKGKTFIGLFGTADGKRKPVTAHTLFEIGDATQTFTTTLLGLDVARGKAKLQDAAQDFLPDITLDPSFADATLGQLADFSSGLPDLPPAVRNKPVSQTGLKKFSVTEFFDFIQSWESKGKLPARYLYSNSSIGLLGYCLAGDTTEKGINKWAQRVEKEILRPLRMSDTTAFPKSKERSRLAVGFLENGKRAPELPVQAWAASNVLKSSISDLAKYLAAYLGEARVSSQLKRAMAVATKPRYFTKQKGTRFGQALAWERYGDGTLLKEGQTPGFSSAIAFNKGADIGVVVLVNQGGHSVDGFADEIAETIGDGAVGGGSQTLTNGVGVAQFSYLSGVSQLSYGTLGGAIVKSGAGTLTLGGTSGYAGVTVSVGTIRVSDLNFASDFGTTAYSGITVIGSGGTLAVTGGTAVIAGATLTVNGRPVTLTGGTLTLNGGTLTLDGTLYDLTGKQLIIGGGNVTLDGQILSAFPPVVTTEAEPEPEAETEPTAP